MVVRSYIDLPVNNQGRCKFYGTAQSVTGSILVCVIQLSGEFCCVVGVHHTRTLFYCPQDPTAISVTRNDWIAARKSISRRGVIRRGCRQLAGRGAQMKTFYIVIGSRKINVSIPVWRRAEVPLQIAAVSCHADCVCY